MFLEPLSIGGNFSRYSGGNPEMKRFTWYFERSPFVQHYILGQFRRYINDEREAIENDVNIFINEADKDFDPLKDRGKKKIIDIMKGVKWRLRNEIFYYFNHTFNVNWHIPTWMKWGFRFIKLNLAKDRGKT